MNQVPEYMRAAAFLYSVVFVLMMMVGRSERDADGRVGEGGWNCRPLRAKAMPWYSRLIR